MVTWNWETPREQWTEDDWDRYQDWLLQDVSDDYEDDYDDYEEEYE